MLKRMNFTKKIHINQFGYRKKTSCKSAYFVVNETCNYYRHKNSNIFLVSLDASKAFDKLWRHGLFYKLIDEIEDSIWRILFRYYQLSKVCVMFNNEKSIEFLITEGVKQGGVLSPYLFNLYVNDLIKSCVEADLGANIDGTNLSIIAYCDDIIILSPIAFHAQMLLGKIYDYSKKWMIEFNASK